MFFLTAVLFIFSTAFAQQTRAIKAPLSQQATPAELYQGDVNGETFRSVALQNEGSMRAPGDVLFSEDFNGTTFPPAGWNRIHTGTNQAQTWQRSTSSAYEGASAFHEDFNYGSGNERSSYLITPAITLPAGIECFLEFMSRINDYGGYYYYSGIMISTTVNNNIAAFSEIAEINDYLNTTWEQKSVSLKLYAGQTVYLAFVYTAIFSHDWRVDNVAVVEGDLIKDNDLSISGVYPFTQVPVSQTLITTHSARILNEGQEPQTNVVFNVNFNGTDIGASAPHPSLAPGANVTLTATTSAAPIVLGNNPLIYSVDQAETDQIPSNNAVTGIIIGTESRLAADDGYPAWNIGNTSPISLGNVFTITQETTLNAVEMRFSASTPTAFSISLYPMNGAVPGTAIFTQAATKPTTAGFITVFVPTTVLTPGNYFLCANQLTTTNFSINSDGNPNRFGSALLGTTFYPNINTAYGNVMGAVFIRMLVDLPPNDLQLLAENPILPFSKIPKSQAAAAIGAAMPFPTALTARAFNTGVAAQTNVEFSATLNGTSLGASTPIASLASGTTSAVMTINPPAGTVYPSTPGTHEIVYTVTQTETDAHPEDNTATFTFEIGDKYAIDGVTVCDNGVGSNDGTISAGNIFTIYYPTTLTAVEVGHGTNVPSNYTITLHSMTGATAINATPLFTVPVVRAGGFTTIPVPATQLNPGSYYLCVNQIESSVNISISYDTRAAAPRLYTKTLIGTALNMQASFGAGAIRMIVDDGDLEFATITTAVTPESTGSVAGGGYYPVGANVSLKAVPVSGFKFQKWDDNVTDNPRTFTATVDATYTAIFEVTPCTDVALGTGTAGVNYIPINTYYNRSYTQQIFRASELGSYTEDMNITSVSFQWMHATAVNYSNITIYMAHTNKETFATTTDWVPIEDLQVVFTGSIPFSNANLWTTIEFSTPFIYEGGNVVLAVYNNHGSYPIGNNTATFYTNTSLANTTLYHMTDSPLTPSNTLSGTRVANRNNVVFEFCPIPPVCEDVAIGAGTTTTYNIPINTYYSYSYTQQIFDTGEIGFLGNALISSLSFQYIHTTGQIKENQTIYLGNTTKSVFASTTDWVPVSELTPAYIGSIDYNNSETWVTVEFEEPFTYTGDNLVIAVLNNHGSYSTGSTPTFRVHNTGSGVYKSLQLYKDNTPAGPIDPAALPTGTGPTYNYTSQLRNNIQFNICGRPIFMDMQAMSITGPTSTVEEGSETYAVTVANKGNGPASGYTVQVLTEDGTLLGQTTTVPVIEPKESATVNVLATFLMNGSIKIKGRVEINGDVDLSNNETELFDVKVIDKCVDLDNSPSVTITTGTVATNYTLPVNNLYNRSYTQQIYDAAEIGLEPGTVISSISFLPTHSSTNNYLKLNQSIYLANTTKSTFTGATDHIPANQLQLVVAPRDITYPHNSNPQWFTIDFDQPFTYTGENIVVVYVNNHGAWSSANTFRTGTATGKAIAAYTDNVTEVSPTNIVGTTTTYTYRNHVMFSALNFKEFPFNPILGDGAAVTLSTPNPVPCREHLIATFSCPDPCYYITNILIGGVPVSNLQAVLANGYDFGIVTEPLPVVEVVTVSYQYEITVTYGANGAILLDNAVVPNGSVLPVACGVNKTFVLKPDQGYTVASLTVDGEDKAIPSNRKYNFMYIQANHTIHVEFEEYPQREICFEVIGQGTVYSVFDGENSEVTEPCFQLDSGTMYQQFLFVPAEHYTIQAIYINGVLNNVATASGSYVFTNIVLDQHVKVVFKLNDYIITATAGANGSIQPAGNVSVPYGGSKQFTFSPNTGYTIDQVFINNVPNPGAALAGNYTFENVTENQTIHVTFKVATLVIHISWSEGGSVYPEGNTYTPTGPNTGDVYVFYNAIQKLIFTPQEGYKVSMVYVNGVAYPNAIPIGSYTFYYITQESWLHVTFEKYTYPVTAQINGNGMIAPQGTTYVPHGDAQTYTFYAMPGYKIVNVFIDGFDNEAAITSGTHTFTNVTAPHTIDVITAIETYTIKAEAGIGGFITPSGDITVNYGGNQYFTFVAASGYEIEKVLVDGLENMEALQNGAYAFTNVKENHTINIFFKTLRYTMTSIAGPNGYIEPAGITEVNYGEDITYTITPDEGYEISHVLINGVNWGAINTYTFTAIEADGDIEVFFILLEEEEEEEEEEGIHNTTIEGISIYSHANIVYIVNENHLMIDVSIFDMYGRIVWQGKPVEQRIELNVANGIYTVRILAGEKFTAKRVSIQR